MDFTLYYAKNSGSLAVRILINEIGLECNYIAVNLKSLMTEHGENFLLINDKGTVPTLITKNNLMLTENQVIQQHIADRYGVIYDDKYSLLPPTNEQKRYLVLDWLNYINTELHYKYCAILFNKDISTELKEEIFKPLFKQQLEYVNKKIEGQTFLVGSNFTIADAHLFTILWWLPQFNINISEFSNLEKYLLFLKDKASIQKALKEKNMI